MDQNIGKFDWDGAFSVDFDLSGGRSKAAVPTCRRLSQMRDMYADGAAAEAVLAQGDPLVYEFYELGCPERPGDLAFGTTILYPGRVGEEYYMTKGHFHTVLATAEVYYTLNGGGLMLMEDPEGHWMAEALAPGQVCYVPRRFAHRMINTGEVPLVTFFVFPADAGHDYGTIETKGYRKLVEQGMDGRPEIRDNPKWQGG